MIFRFFLLIIFPFSMQAQIAPDKIGPELIDFLQQNYSPSGTLGYGPARDILWADIDSEGNDLFGVYTNFKVTLNPSADPTQSAYQNGAGINAEHVYPQSKGAGDEPQRSDMHNIFPSKVNVNEARGSCEFGDVDDADTENWYYLDMISNNIPTSNIDNYSEKDTEDCMFEPRESVKGNIARAVFYFYTIYQSDADAADPNFFHNQKATLLQWHDEDPADQKEMERNDLISDEQGNLNPFITDPTLAQRAFFPLNIEDLEKADLIKLATNVVRNEIQIFVEKENVNILLYSIDGRLQNSIEGTGELFLDVNNLPAGLYLLQAQSENNLQTFRIIKQ